MPSCVKYHTGEELGLNLCVVSWEKEKKEMIGEIQKVLMKRNQGYSRTNITILWKLVVNASSFRAD